MLQLIVTRAAQICTLDSGTAASRWHCDHSCAAAAARRVEGQRGAREQDSVSTGDWTRALTKAPPKPNRKRNRNRNRLTPPQRQAIRRHSASSLSSSDRSLHVCQSSKQGRSYSVRKLKNVVHCAVEKLHLFVAASFSFHTTCCLRVRTPIAQ
jgi:hypothetical protein